MSRLLVTSASAIALIFFVAFVASRLLAARSKGFSIRLQFFLALASMVGAFAIGLGVLVLDRLEARTTLITQGAAGEEAQAIAALVGSEIEALESRKLGFEEVARRYAAAPRPTPGEQDRGLSLVDPEGRVIFSSGLLPAEPNTVFAEAPIVARGHSVGRVRVVKRTIVIRRALADMAPFILVVSIVLGLSVAAAADFIGRSIARPLESLTDFAERVSEGERRAAPPPAHGREVQKLTRAIDSMRRQLEGRPFVETFAADLSHELKNPVAAIRASAEVLADGALEEPEEAMRFVVRIQEATARIEALLNDLLSLARIEARGLEESALVELGEVIEQARARVRERGVEVEFARSSAIRVRGDARWLCRAVENLLDNAAIHGDPSEPVRLAVLREGDLVRISIKNKGQIVKPVETRLFRRFVTTRADRGGTGLGLAIVRAIAEAHSGSAECTAKGPPEVEFRITLPSA